MNIEQMSERLQKILMDAINLAKSNQHPSVDTVDMLETILRMMYWMVYLSVLA